MRLAKDSSSAWEKQFIFKKELTNQPYSLRMALCDSIVQAKQMEPQVIYNPITAMGFSAMFTF